MTEHNQISTQPTEARSTVRKKAYLSYIEKYPLYATLLVLEEYEKEEVYEECAIIMEALVEFRDRYLSKFPKDMQFPLNIPQYKDKKYQDFLKKLKINIEEKEAKEKATLIKLNLPVNEL